MSTVQKFFNDAEDFITKYDLNCSVEELFVAFEELERVHEDFNQYLNEMRQRCEKALDRRKLFSEWYFLKYQNQKNTKSILKELAEMEFVSERTVINQLK